MNHFKTVRIGNNPLLVIGSAALAFGITHFYFNQSDAEGIIPMLGHILLIPYYLFASACKLFGFQELADKVVIIFIVLMISYSAIAFFISKITELIISRQQKKSPSH